MVKPYKLGNSHGKGVSEALQFNALSDDDSTTIKNVPTYAEFWLYLTGKMKMPDSANNALDREIFSGPTVGTPRAPPGTPPKHRP